MKRIRFMHVPKSAGTSFFDCLSGIYPGEKFVFLGDLRLDLERYEALDPSQKEKLVLFGGHAPRFTGQEAVDRVPTITLLRNPIQRVISLLQHISEGKGPFDKSPPHTLGVDRWLGSGDKQLSNYLARTVLSDHNYNLPDLGPDSIIEKALDQLNNGIECFGFVEHFDESLILFRRTLGWKQWPVLPRLNEADRQRPVKISDKQMDTIRKLNAIDVEIYERALRVFRRRLKRKVFLIQTDLLRFRVRQKARKYQILK